MSNSEIKRTSGSREAPKTYYSRWMPKGVMETCFRGEVTGRVAELAEDEFFVLAKKANQQVLVWFVDTIAVTGFSKDIGKPGTHFVRRFKDQGGKVMIVAIKNMGVRMMASVIATAAGMPMDIKPTREAALAHLINTVLPKLDNNTL